MYFSSGSGTPRFELLSSETIGSLSSVGANARVVLNGNTLTIADGGSQSFLGTVSGTGGVAKAGTGTQVFSGPNTYSGVTAVNGGILRISHAQALGSTDGGTSVASGATLELEGGITVAGESLALAGIGYNNSGALRNLSGNNIWTGPITTSGGQVNVPSSTGLLTLSGPITLHDLQTQYNLVLIPATNGNILVSGDISGGGDGATADRRSVTLGSASTGVATLSGTNTYLGRTSINGGTLRVEGGAAIPDASMVLFGNNTVLEIGDAETVGSLTGGATATIKLDTNTLTVGAANNSTEAVFSGVVQGTGGITKTGSGVQTLSGANTYDGETLVSAGVLRIGHNTALGTTSGGTTVAAGAAMQLQGGITVAGESLSVVGDGIHFADSPGALRNISGNNTWTGPITIGSALTRIASDSGTLTLEGDILLSGSATNHLVLQGNGNITITGNISGGGTGQTLTRSGVGSGLMTLAGTNTYGGITTITAGTLAVADGSAIPDGSRVYFSSGSGSPTLDLLNSETIGSLSSVGANAKVTLNANTLTIADGASQNFHGSISGAGGVTKTGSGVQVFSGANLYAGLTRVSGGTLRVEGGAAIPDASRVNLSGGGTLELGNDETIGSLLGVAGTTVNLNANTLTVGADNDPVLQNFTGAITGTGGLTKVGTGIQALTGTNTYTGDTIIEQGILHIGSTGSIDPASAIKVAEDGTHRVVVLAAGGGASAGSRRSELHSTAGNAVQLPAAITAVASTATSLVDMQWRPRTTAEQSRQLSSDVLTLSNTFPTTAQAFVLQMAYDPALPWIAGREVELIGDELIYLVSDASGNWENAVLGNTSGSPLWMGDTAAPSSDLFSKLGWHGVDTSSGTHVAWAVLNYGDSFSVVAIPEPGTLALLAAGLLVFVCPRRKRK